MVLVCFFCAFPQKISLKESMSYCRGLYRRDEPMWGAYGPWRKPMSWDYPLHRVLSY